MTELSNKKMSKDTAKNKPPSKTTSKKTATSPTTKQQQKITSSPQSTASSSNPETEDEKSKQKVSDKREQVKKALQNLGTDKPYFREAILLSLLTDPRSKGKQLEVVIANVLLYSPNLKTFLALLPLLNLDKCQGAATILGQLEQKSPLTVNKKLFYLNTLSEQPTQTDNYITVDDLIDPTKWEVEFRIIVPLDDSTGPGPDIIVQYQQFLIFISCKYSSLGKITKSTMDKARYSVKPENFFGKRVNNEEGRFNGWKKSLENHTKTNGYVRGLISWPLSVPTTVEANEVVITKEAMMNVVPKPIRDNIMKNI
ncbi:predicted protein [Naegleria gruberi]|uniref:Predicted protein n=1 Tax=Naegleria gruberi TaxID=5762 RepID=D2V0R8_NAEGR|nr:uncharacterized protein NAEGRDRAFT_45758 [Naegleria gruberi]EFC49776.1 predicted protein [Naegleria gruberi]|eukprot:XP_002682520.1 predicted protein [Naegleria gruberi strain NEG-M]